MCFSSNTFKTRNEAREYGKGEVAKQNIIVYKVVKKTNILGDVYYQSAVKNFVYELGFHYYQTGKRPIHKRVTKKRYWPAKGWRVEIDSGLHSYHNLNLATEALQWGGERVILECIIPKGSRYWVYNGYAVSTDLIIVKELKDVKQSRLRMVS